MFDVGDTVALSGPLIMQLATDHPPVFEYLRESRRHGGQVQHIEGNSIHVDIGMDRPLIIDIDPEQPDQLIQIVQKVEGAEPEPAPAMPAPEQVTQPVGEEAGEMTLVGLQGPFSVLDGSPFQQMFQNMVARGRPHYNQPQAEQGPPAYVRAAQWVINHFADMKKFTITQDINDGQRRQTLKAQRLSGDMDEVYDNERVPIRAGLSAAETKLYEEALGLVGDWMDSLKNSGQTPQTPAQPAPQTEAPAGSD